MVVYCDGENLFCLFLADDIFIKVRLDFLRGGDVIKFLRLCACCAGGPENLLTCLDTFVTDGDNARTGNQLLVLDFVPAAE